MHDATAIGKLCHSIPISDVELSTADGIFMAGGHGTWYDQIHFH